jgi:hypothetical protein
MERQRSDITTCSESLMIAEKVPQLLSGFQRPADARPSDAERLGDSGGAEAEALANPGRFPSYQSSVKLTRVGFPEPAAK